MSDYNIVLPSKPRIIKEDKNVGMYEIDGLYPGYGHTLGNSLRRIILSSLPGAAITTVKIAGVAHEFSVLSGVKEDVITILLNLRKVRIEMLTDEPQVLSLKVKGIKEVKAGDIKTVGQIEIINPELPIATITDKNTELDIEITVEKGLGYVSREALKKNTADIGVIILDAIFTPIRRVNYEVENMRVGDRTDFNRLKVFIETDGTISPNESLEQAIEIMISQLKAIVGFKEDAVPEILGAEVVEEKEVKAAPGESDTEFLKTRIESLDLSARTVKSLSKANIRTVGGLARKKESDLLDIEGLGPKGIQEVKKALAEHGIILKD